MKIGKYTFLVVLWAVAIVSCHEEKTSSNKNYSSADYQELDSSAFRLNSHRIRANIVRLARADNDSLQPDSRTRRYYRGGGNFLWIDRQGVDARADSLLAHLHEVEALGFSRRKFRVEEIEADLRRVRTLKVDTGSNALNLVMARLEYNLTKAFLRYVSGQRFGFVNPTWVFNRLDVHEGDSTGKSYRALFDVAMEHVTKDFYWAALRKIYNDSVAIFLHEVQPKSPLYQTFLARLKRQSLSPSERIQTLCNLERSRWRLADIPQNHEQYVWVNIPSFHLDAVRGDSVLTMRMACGNVATKTPLLTSRIMRMDINPQWVIPRSIIRKEMVRHVADPAYFESHRYVVRERRSGRPVDLNHLTTALLLSPDHCVVQSGGEGNALGRIIFRFANNFSIFIHDTSSKEAFARDNRGVSHGCIRVEQPFDLAVFMLADKDERLIEKIKYSMEVNLYPAPSDAQSTEWKKPDRSKLVNSLRVNPEIPVFIAYYTLYPDKRGAMRSYPDVYGYDQVLYGWLKNYIE